MTTKVHFRSAKYGEVQAFLEYSRSREQYEATVYFKLPVHLYDFVYYQPAGKHTTYFGDGRVEEGYHEEEIGTTIYTRTQNVRLDFVWSDDTLTEAAVEDKIDEEFRDAIENNDGVLVFEKIIGVKT